MSRLMKALFNDASQDVRGKIIGMYLLLLIFNLGAWIAAFVTFRQHPLLLGTAFLAYSFGLRHAVDADHIAAIDNVTRKLMQEGKKPVSVGFMFSLGHSTVVILACLAIAATALAMKGQLDSFREIGGMIGTIVSALFLLVIAVINLVVANRGFLARIFRPMFKIITRSWHMYPLGILFGLGFDTSTEIALLGISATQASNGLSVWSIMIFPLLFTAGMSLIDTTDSILMLGAYGWAFVKPIRKLYYNMTITLVSVLVAIAIGGIEVLGLLADKLQLSGTFWDAVANLNEHFGMIGYIIIGLFILSWAISIAIYKWRRYDDIELTLESAAK